MLTDNVDRIVAAGSHGHCLHNYASLRRTNVESTKTLALWAYRRRIPVHFVSSNRVTLLAQEAGTMLSPSSVQQYMPKDDGSEGLTASKWAGEVFLERFADQAAGRNSSIPITIHRPCSLIGDEAPLDDALNSILRFSILMDAVPRIASLPVAGYFDFAPVEAVAEAIAEAATDTAQPFQIRFHHRSGGVKVTPAELRGHLETLFNKHFEELELEEWTEKALKLGVEPMIAIHLRAVFSSGQQLVISVHASARLTCRGSEMSLAWVNIVRVNLLQNVPRYSWYATPCHGKGISCCVSQKAYLSPELCTVIGFEAKLDHNHGSIGQIGNYRWRSRTRCVYTQDKINKLGIPGECLLVIRD
ncbi:Putative fatty acyl-coenzyme A reductase, NAD-binding domain, NAD(P)-binding domain superfamily [Septoria linicola]|uniref:Fatty acyl-coenzyme A reductase, NAD-binding domain, NAD(P)-binding domain superfamily n=1 Tax=Septoria linicola TaxID=215465 RepID=A0A9Q9AYN7_9PEZI|nr:putative fatty acyl-coenzyme A reductase, NAD-binding domain, NAD(P)-binding domain superfamily [Septoria linicola]USW57545.1 Putative fatty acyl-coenzyme A reductase, NAD-binding domain, NAD(P)-binding domain superfamily [Septoria linicola]